MKYSLFSKIATVFFLSSVWGTLFASGSCLSIYSENISEVPSNEKIFPTEVIINQESGQALCIYQVANDVDVDKLKDFIQSGFGDDEASASMMFKAHDSDAYGVTFFSTSQNVRYIFASGNPSAKLYTYLKEREDALRNSGEYSVEEKHPFEESSHS